jgi:hypothetical protein
MHFAIARHQKRNAAFPVAVEALGFIEGLEEVAEPFHKFTARMDSMTAKEREEFARMGGTAGGKARAAKLSKTERQDIAKKAAQARWAKKSGRR